MNAHCYAMICLNNYWRLSHCFEPKSVIWVYVRIEIIRWKATGTVARHETALASSTFRCPTSLLRGVNRSARCVCRGKGFPGTWYHGKSPFQTGRRMRRCPPTSIRPPG